VSQLVEQNAFDKSWKHFLAGVCEPIRCNVVQKGRKVEQIIGKYWNEMKVQRSLARFSLRPRESDALDIPKDCKVERGMSDTSILIAVDLTSIRKPQVCRYHFATRSVLCDG